MARNDCAISARCSQSKGKLSGEGCCILLTHKNECKNDGLNVICSLEAATQSCPRGSDRGIAMTPHRIYTMSFASVYPHYVAKAERKGRTKAEVDEIIRWLTGYSQEALEAQIGKGTNLEVFMAQAPRLNPSRAAIKGVICGVRK